MSGRHVVVLDEGTTSTRAVLFDADSRVVTSSALPLETSTLPGGQVEQDAAELWSASRTVLREVIAFATARDLDVAALAIAVQRTTTVVWDAETGEPAAPMISWQDSRTAQRVADLSPHCADKAAATTGLVFSVANVGLHLEWLLQNNPSLRALVDRGRLRAGTPEAWIIWKLTGGPRGGTFATSTSCAGSTGIFDPRAHVWWEELLSALHVPVEILPSVRPEDDDYGHTSDELVGAEIPITGVLGDQQSALFGHGGFDTGAVKCTHGTGSFIDFNIGPRPIQSTEGLDCRIGWTTRYSRAYMIEGGSFVTGSGVEWLVDRLGVLPAADQLDAVYAEGRTDTGLISVPALTGFAAPYWDSTARGMMIGFNRATTAADVVRATVDGIAHTVVDVIEAMARNSGTEPTVVSVDGGLGRSDALLQAQADLLQIPVIRAAQSEFITARGAAWCAGIAQGVWADLDEALITKTEGEEFFPRMNREERDLRRQAWNDAVGRALGWRRTTLPASGDR